jgi:AcrR family transcriptional regulator
MGRPAGRRSDETRALILSAAEEEFASAGYDGARTVEIARRAGVTHAMLHYYFETKDALYAEALRHVFAELGTRLTAMRLTPDAGESRVAALRSLVVGAHEIYLRRPQLCRLMLWEVAAGGPRLEAVAGAFYDQLVDTMMACRRLVRSPHRIEDVAVTLLGALIVFFFDDPIVVRFYGADRRRSAAGRRRSLHLAALVDGLFVARGRRRGRSHRA